MKANPDQQKVDHYDKKVKAHKQKADEYRARAAQCEDAERNNR